MQAREMSITSQRRFCTVCSRTAIPFRRDACPCCSSTFCSSAFDQTKSYFATALGQSSFSFSGSKLRSLALEVP